MSDETVRIRDLEIARIDQANFNGSVAAVLDELRLNINNIESKVLSQHTEIKTDLKDIRKIHEEFLKKILEQTTLTNGNVRELKAWRICKDETDETQTDGICDIKTKIDSLSSQLIVNENNDSKVRIFMDKMNHYKYSITIGVTILWFLIQQKLLVFPHHWFK